MPARFAATFLVAALGLAAHARASGIATDSMRYDYRLTFSGDLSRLSVTACFAGPPEYLIAGSNTAAHLLVDGIHFRSAKGNRTVNPRGHVVRLADAAVDDCVHYQVDAAAAGRLRDMDQGWRTPASLALSPRVWLWRPPNPGPRVRLIFHVEVPADMNFSAPWQPMDKAAPGGHRVFQANPTPIDWTGTIAVGKFISRNVAVPGARLRFALLDGPASNADPDLAERWVRGAAREVSTVYGRFPLGDVQVLIIPLSRGSEPAPFGEVTRGGGTAVHLLMNVDAPPAEFATDWVAVHEFSHMLLPYVDRRDAWFSEGLATYYQDVLRARSGEMTPLQTWRHMEAGFERGRRDTRDTTLAQTARRMHHDRAYMRVYWSGAAIALMADVRLRRESHGRQSLDTVLEKLDGCCVTPDREWRALDLMKKMDELAGREVFVPLYRRWALDTAFPDLTDTYRALGVPGGDGKLARLDDSAPEADIRRAIMAKRPPAE